MKNKDKSKVLYKKFGYSTFHLTKKTGTINTDGTPRIMKDENKFLLMRLGGSGYFDIGTVDFHDDEEAESMWLAYFTPSEKSLFGHSVGLMQELAKYLAYVQEQYHLWLREQ